MAIKDYSSIVEKARKKKKEGKNTESDSLSVKDYSSTVRNHKLTKRINFDTLDSDISSLATTISSAYDGWQSEETMKNTKSSIVSMQNRLNSLQEYRKMNGITEDDDKVNELVEGYKSILDGWDDLSMDYGQYKSVDAYKKAIDDINSAAATLEKQKTDNVQVLQKELDELKVGLDKVKQNIKSRKNDISDLFSLKHEDSMNSQQASEQEYKDLLKSYGFESYEDFKKAVGEKEAYLKQTQLIQDGMDLSSFADETSENYDVDFGKYAQKGEDIGLEKNKWYESLSDNMVAYMRNNPDYMESYEQSIDDQNNFTKSAIKSDKGYLTYLLAKHGTKEEYDLYNYHFAKDVENGTNNAEKYLLSIADTINIREGQATAEKYKDKNALSKIMFGGESGTDQFVSGVRNAANFTDDYIPTTSTQYASQGIRKQLYDTGFDLPNWLGGTSIGQVAYDAVNTTANMIPSIAAGTAADVLLPGAGTYVTAGLMGLSASGNAYQQMLNQGYNKTSSRTYATLVGLSEASLSALLSGMIGGKATEKAIENVIKGIDKGFFRFAVRWGMSGASEIPEESLQGILEPILQNIALGYEKNKLEDTDWSQIAYEGLLGGISGLGLGGVTSASSTIVEQSTWKNAGKNVRENARIPEMLNIANLTPQESDAYNTYTRYANKGINAENITDVQLGRLYDEVKEDATSTLKSRKTTNEQKTKALKTLTSLETVHTENTEAKAAKRAEELTKGNEVEETTISGKSAKIEGIKLGKDNTTVVTSEGEVSIDDVSFAQQDAELVARAETIAKDMGENVANVFLSQYDAKTNGTVSEYVDSFNLAMEYTKKNQPLVTMLENKGTLTNKQVSEIHNATVVAQYRANENAKTELTQKHSKKIFLQGNFDDSIIDRSSKTTDGSKVNWNSLTPTQRGAINFARLFSKATGVNIRFIKSEVVDGKHKGKNGSYDPSTNTIEIDVYAGRMDASVVKDSIIPTLSHELTHWMKDKSPAIYNSMREDIIKTLTENGKYSSNEMIAKEIQRMKAAHPDMEVTSEDAVDELVARACEDMLSNSNEARKLLNRMSESEQQSFIEKVKETFENLIQWVNDLLSHYKSDSDEAKVLQEYKHMLKKVSKQWDAMLVDAIKTNQALQHEGIKAEKNTTNEGDVKMSIREEFYAEFDKWVADGRKDTNIRFVVGTTSDVLKSIGMKDQEIILPSGTINKKLKKHTELTVDIVRNIPNLLEHPVIIQFSDAIDPKTNKPKYDSRITLLGELYADMVIDGKNEKKPVLVSMELLPTNQKKTTVLDFSVITSVYGHSKLQQYLNDNSILYIDPNKKRTNKWLSLNRLQLPLGETKFGSIRRITYSDNKVKIQNSTNKTAMEIALEKAGIVDEFGNSKYSDRDDIDIQINQSMTMDEAKTMIQKAFVLGGIKEWYDNEYKNGDEWLKARGADEVAMYIENEYTLQEKYINKIQGIIDDEFYMADVLEAYLNGTLTGKEKAKAKRLDTSKEYRINDERFYSPQHIKDVKKLLNVASMRMTDKTRAEVSNARAKILLFAHNKGASEMLGLTQAELNKKLRVWSGYSAKAIDVSKKINNGIADSNKWTGIENCSWLVKSQVSDEELGRLVKEIKGTSNPYERNYIARTMLALDTHIDWTELTFDFKRGFADENRRSVRGLYNNRERTITIGGNSGMNTVAHEMGHALDYKWQRDLFGEGRGNENCLSENFYRLDLIEDADAQQFVKNFKIFIDSLTDVNVNYSEYTMKNSETFARFVAKFVEWTEQIAGGRSFHETDYYGDKFTTSQYVEFVKLLQEKAMLDAKRMSESEGVKFSDRDSAYMEAVNNNDMETAQRLVEEVAKEAGYNSPTLYHGTPTGFGFTVFDSSKVDDKLSFFATNDERTAKTYSGETNRRNITDRITVDVDNASPTELLELLQKHIDEKYQLVSKDELEKIKAPLYETIRNSSNIAREFILENSGAFNDEKRRVAYRIVNSISAMADAETESELDGARASYQDATWELRAIDSSIAYELLDAIDTTKLFRAVDDIDLYSNSEALFTNGIKTINDNSAWTILSSTLYTGVYSLYGNTDGMLEIDANGANWNRINTKSIQGTKHYVTVEDGYDSTDVPKMMSFNDAQTMAYNMAKSKYGEDAKIHTQDIRDDYGYPSSVAFRVVADGMIGEKILVLNQSLQMYTNTRGLARYAKDAGYNGVKISNLKDSGGAIQYNVPSDIYIFFNSSQMKSADPVTYDDNGNVIPLSERFNKGNEDIRYSDRDSVSIYDKMGETEKLIKENAQLKEDVERLKERLKLEGKVTHGEYFNQNQLDAVAGHIRNIANSTFDKKILASLIDGIYKYIAHSPDLNWQDMFAQCYDVARMVLNEAKPLTETNDYYKMVLKNIRGARISVNEQQIQNAKYRLGNKWRNVFFGKVNITDNATSLDRQWQEWSSAYPDIFDAELTNADMLVELYDIFDSLREGSETIVEYDMEEQTRWIAYEIYNKFWSVQPIRTTADKYTKQIQRLKFEHRKAMDNLRKQRDEKLKAQHKVDKQKAVELYKNLRERKDKEIAEVKKLGKERLDAYKENAERKTLIQSITATSLSLNKQLTTNSKDKYVHETMKPVVINLLNAIDFSSKQLLGMKGTVIDRRGTPTRNDISLAKSLSKVKDMFAQANGENATGEFIDLYGYKLSEEMEMMIDSAYDTALAFGDNEFILHQMNVEQLKSLDQLVKVIKHTVLKVNEFHTIQSKQGIYGVANETIEYLDKLGKGKEHKKIGSAIIKSLSWNNTTPYYAFKRFGEAGMKVFKSMMKGWDKLAFNSQKIEDFANATYTSKEAIEWEKEIKTFEISQPDGEIRKVKMPTSFVMALYCVSKQEDAIRHLTNRGMTLATIDDNGKVNTEYDNTILTLEDIKRITSTLTKRQLEVADKLQKFLNEECTDWANEISLKRFGIKMFSIKNYFPIKVSPSTVLSEDVKDTNGASLYALLNMSWTKPRNENATESIEIGSIFDVFAKHTSEIAKYNALALPILDMNRWYAFKGKTELDKEYGVDLSLKKAFGKDSVDYIRTFLKDLNGQKNVARENFNNFFFRNAKVAAVAGNLRVILLQPTAYLKASAVIKDKYLLKSFLYANDVLALKGIKKAQQYCGMAQWKSQGYYDVNITKGLAEKIKHTDTKREKLIEKSLKGAEWADKITFGMLWNACEFEIRETRKDLKVGSQEFYETIGDRLNEIIYATQVVDSTMTRSQVMRSSDRMDKVLTAFMSEPTIAYNMLLDTVSQANIEKREKGKVSAETRKKAFRVVLAYTTTNMLAALVESAFDAFRDDDDEEKEFEDYVPLYLKNFASDMSIIGKIPYLKEITSLLQGYSSSRTDTQWMNNLIYAYKSWVKYFSGEGGGSKAVKYTLKSFSDISGLAFYNAYRDLMAALNKLDIFTTEDLEEMLNELIS